MPPVTNNSKRIAIISDTHGHIDPKIINVIKDCDQIIHAGDICGAHILEELQEIHDDITAVCGNNDRAELWHCDEAHVVNAIPDVAELKLPGGILMIEHGHKHGIHQPCHDSLRKSHPNARAVVYGHTHTMVVDDEHNPMVINPGAAGETRTRGGPSCLILTASESDWHVEKIRFSDAEIA